MLIVGLLVTWELGRHWQSVIATIYVHFASIGFSVPATILLIAVAGVLGDVGSPDTALGPTSGLNADGQHDLFGIRVPSFLLYNIPLLILGLSGR